MKEIQTPLNQIKSQKKPTIKELEIKVKKLKRINKILALTGIMVTMFLGFAWITLLDIEDKYEAQLFATASLCDLLNSEVEITNTLLDLYNLQVEYINDNINDSIDFVIIDERIEYVDCEVFLDE